MVSNANRIKRFRKAAISSVVGAISWTLILTPYVVLIMRMDLNQYLSWLGMQFILVPLVAPIVFYVTEMAVARNNGSSSAGPD